MHPLVRDLYKRVIWVGKDYPQGLDYVRDKWKKALRNPHNCPSCYNQHNGSVVPIVVDDDASYKIPTDCERELRKAVGKGRHMVREMEGIIQLKKYRTMNKRYGKKKDDEVEIAMQKLISKSK